MNIYRISGLGADQRAFANLVFDPKYTLVHLSWIPHQPDETLEEYAQRLGSAIDTTKPFCLIGLSLGGMMATEIAKVLRPQKTILLSSVGRYHELPWLYRIGGQLRLHKLLPNYTANHASAFLYWLFSITRPQDKKMLKQVMADSDVHFTRWAIDAVTKWRNTQTPKNIIRIHGDKDRVIPITSFTPDYMIPKGGHLMVANRAKEVSAILDEVLKR